MTTARSRLPPTMSPVEHVPAIGADRWATRPSGLDRRSPLVLDALLFAVVLALGVLVSLIIMLL